MRYFPQQVLLCTKTVHDQSADICIQGYVLGSFGYEIQNLQKYTKFINSKFYVT